jgi:two-component system cell cycle response regulator
MVPSKESNLDETIIITKADVKGLRKSVASLVIVKGNDIGNQFFIRRNSLVIGRSESADIVIRDKRISRFHAKIDVTYIPQEKRASYTISDLGSTNHVYVNGQKVQSRQIENDDKIQLGKTILKFEIQDKIDSKFHADIQRKVKYDGLTSLLTYESFKDAVNWEITNAGARNRKLVLLMMDLDNFKKVNDTYGHLTGSFILKEIGRLINDNLRLFDISARYGGEEFVSCLPDTDKREAFHAAERLRNIIADNVFVHDNKRVKITISIGLSQFPDNGLTLEELVRSSDEMLYRAKSDGKNRVVVAGGF